MSFMVWMQSQHDLFRGRLLPQHQPAVGTRHYWFILSEPGQDEHRILVANITSWDDMYGDAACALQAGDHPRITRRCSVNYEDLRIVGLSVLEHLQRGGLISSEPAASIDLLQLMQQGALESEFCPLDHKRILQEQGLPRIRNFD